MKQKWVRSINRKILVGNCVYKFYFVSVNSQSLLVAPDPVVGVLKESVDITWTLRRVDQADRIITISLYLGNYTENKYLYDGTHGLTKMKLANEMFGERIQTSFKEPDYILTLRNMSFTDAVTFSLAVVQRVGNAPSLRDIALKSVAISVVRGMYFFASF